MKKPIVYTDEPMEGRVIKDFLPPPSALRRKLPAASKILDKPKHWTNKQGQKFVLIPANRFEEVRQIVEDAQDVLTLRLISTKHRGTSGITMAGMQTKIRKRRAKSSPAKVKARKAS